MQQQIYLALFRKLMGVSQTALGTMAGISQTEVSDLELGRRPTPRQAEALAKVFKVEEVNEILFETVDEDPVNELLKAKFMTLAETEAVVSPERARFAAESFGIKLRTTNLHGIPNPPDDKRRIIAHRKRKAEEKERMLSKYKRRGRTR